MANTPTLLSLPTSQSDRFGEQLLPISREPDMFNPKTKQASPNDRSNIIIKKLNENLSSWKEG